MSIKKVYETHTEWRNADGLFHRVDGPAVEWDNGSKHWFVNGKLHRADGPAIEGADRYKQWSLNGIRYTEEEHALLNWERLIQEQQDDIIFGQSNVD